MNTVARRMFELVEPIGLIPYTADEPNEAMFALGFTNYWDTYFAGRAAPLGLTPAEVVEALFYNFAPGEVARHIPKVWRTTTPEAAIAARQMGCVKALRRILGDRVDAAALRPSRRTVGQGGDQRPLRGPTHVRRAARHPGPRRRRGPPLSRSCLAARAPWRRAHRGPDEPKASVASRLTSCSPSTWTCRRTSSDASTTSRKRSSPP